MVLLLVLWRLCWSVHTDKNWRVTAAVVAVAAVSLLRYCCGNNVAAPLCRMCCFVLLVVLFICAETLLIVGLPDWPE